MTANAPCYLKKPITPENTIPQNIYQTWSSHIIPDGMIKASQSWKDLNPDWQYQLFYHADLKELKRSHTAVVRILYKNKAIKEARRHWLKTLLNRHRSWRLTEAIIFELQYLFKLG